MATKREKQLATLLLKERLERLTGKKVILEDMINVSKDFEPDAEKHELLKSVSILVDSLNLLSSQWKKELNQLKDGSSPYLFDKENVRDLKQQAEKIQARISDFLVYRP
ncbi:MAG: hypothetical protein PHC93_04395 [Candidatus Omnitrophica bacterium]|nr:hypothetical protein [Candidatus Omnitrophota bacterium]